MHKEDVLLTTLNDIFLPHSCFFNESLYDVPNQSNVATSTSLKNMKNNFCDARFLCAFSRYFKFYNVLIDFNCFITVYYCFTVLLFYCLLVKPKKCLSQIYLINKYKCALSWGDFAYVI